MSVEYNRNDTINNFSLEIETMAYELEISHLDAIVEYCERNDLEIEVAASMLNRNLKSKIEAEAQDLNFLPKAGRLPLE